MTLIQKVPLLTILLLSITAPATAQNNYDLDDLDDGELILNLSASEQAEVDQDTLNATLHYIVQGKDRIALQNEVNQTMAQALEILGTAENIEYSTQQYQVYIVQAGRPNRSDIEEPVWQARQGVNLVGQDSSVILDYVGQLQAIGLTQSNLYYSLSNERFEEVSDSLMFSALEKLQNRADQAAAALGKTSAELIEVSLNGNQNYYPTGQRVAMSMEASSMAQPVAEPGKTTVSMNVSARARLSFEEEDN